MCSELRCVTGNGGHISPYLLKVERLPEYDVCITCPECLAEWEYAVGTEVEESEAVAVAECQHLFFLDISVGSGE